MADPRTHRYTNNAQSLLAVALDADDVIITVESGDGFPEPESGEICKITLENPLTGVREICNCTERTGPAITVERAQEGTTALVWDVGAVVAHRNTAETMEHLEEGSGGGGADLDFAIARGRFGGTGTVEASVGIDDVAWDCAEPGRYVITFSSGYFGAVPMCVANALTTGLGRFATIEAVDVNGVTIQLVTHEGDNSDGDFHLICIGAIGAGPPVPAPNLTDHEIISSGGAGSGSQEPKLDVYLGNGANVPLGVLWVGGGGGGYSFEVDGDALVEGNDPMAMRNFGTFITNEWWQGDTDDLDAADYEVRLTVSSGAAPVTGVPVDEWLNMSAYTDMNWGYTTAFEPPGLSGVWLIEIRPAGGGDNLAACELTVSQVLL